jgi:hypothetical protein
MHVLGRKEMTITLDVNNQGTFEGRASRYAYTPALRAEVDRCFHGAQRSNNRYFVLEGEICRAAQSTKTGAMQYMTENTVLVDCSQAVPTVPQTLLEEAASMWQYRPFRKCFVAMRGDEHQVILKPTAHLAGKMAREGWTVIQLQRS